MIVSIYNVEEYLPKCLASLMSQTFADVEFILVDDGSTDGSGAIVDNYESKDSRFRVFHTMNNGLSAARNFGVDKASGEWIMFVDGDDWVEPTFCEEPYRNAISNNADLVIFQFYKEKNGKRKPSIKGNIPIGVIDPFMGTQYGKWAVWNKLYKKCLFDDIRFPEGHNCEDIAITHRIVFSAKRIVMISDVLYNYVYRKDSITNKPSEKNKRDGFYYALRRYDDLISYGYEKEKHEEELWQCALGYLIRANPSDDPLFEKAEEVVSLIKTTSKKFPVKKKIMLFLWKTDKSLFHYICRVFGQKDESKRTL